MNEYSGWIMPGISVIFGAGISYGILSHWRKTVDNAISKITENLAERPKAADVLTFGTHEKICRDISDSLKEYFDQKFMQRDIKMEALLISMAEIKTALIDIKIFYTRPKGESVT